MSGQLVIEIFPQDAKARVRNVGERQMKSQVGYLYVPEQRFPIKCDFNLPDGVEFYPPGQYTVNAKSVRVGRYDRLEFGFSMYLDPVVSLAQQQPEQEPQARFHDSPQVAEQQLQQRPQADKSGLSKVEPLKAAGAK